MSRSTQERKQQLFGLLASDPDLDIRKIVQKLGTSYNTLKKWKEDYEISLGNAELQKNPEITETLVDKIVKTLPNPKPLVIDPNTDEIITEEQLDIDQAYIKAYKKAISIRVKDCISGLNNLEDATQATALDLITLIKQRIAIIYTKINMELDEEDSEERRLMGTSLPSYTKDLSELASALSGVQNAFFNRPTTNIQVNNVNATENSGLDEFRMNLKN